MPLRNRGVRLCGGGPQAPSGAVRSGRREAAGACYHQPKRDELASARSLSSTLLPFSSSAVLGCYCYMLTRKRCSGQKGATTRAILRLAAARGSFPTKNRTGDPNITETPFGIYSGLPSHANTS